MMARAKKTPKKPTKKPAKKTRGDGTGTITAPKSGRPTLFEQQIADRILDALIDGQTLTKLCKEDWAPHRSTVFRWRAAHAEFEEAYLKARSAQIELRGDEAIDLAEDADTPEKIAQARVKLEARRIVIGRLSALYVVGGDEASPDVAKLLKDARERATRVFDRIQRGNERVATAEAAVATSKPMPGTH